MCRACGVRSPDGEGPGSKRASAERTEQIGATMGRRQFMVQSLKSLGNLALGLGAREPCLAASEPATRGCRALSALDGFRNLISDDSGNPTLDVICREIVESLRAEFEVKPGFCFYDDRKSNNAFADPAILFPEYPDGTVV